MIDSEEEQPAREPRWGIHVALLGVAVLVAIGIVASLKSKQRPVRFGPEAGLEILVGFGDAMEQLGRVLGVFVSAGIYILGSTLLAILLRRRRGALWWAHGSALVAVGLLWVADGYEGARRREEYELRARQQVEADEAKRRARAAEEERLRRNCLIGSLSGDRGIESPIVRGRPTKPISYGIQLTLALQCPGANNSPIEAFRLKGKGPGWELPPVERRITPPQATLLFESAGTLSHAPEEGDIDPEAFVLEVRFSESPEWVVRPIDEVRIRNVDVLW
ncbi:hypothetical protein [Pendulispora albinea]|uniref:Uncharacterized protein n=1 Tax=Pendulispora albinea TaxID=2741071 RepID=A0ABZ2MA53_9BACT